MQSLNYLRNSYINGRLKLRDDEYFGEDGLPYCSKCKTPRFHASEDGSFAVHCACQCQAEENARQKQAEEREKFIEEFNNRKRLSLLGDRYKDVTFEKATITEYNRKAFVKAKAYVDKSDEVLKNNIGLYIYGDNSTGKTFLTACICNGLLWNMRSCVYTNHATILNEIRASYDGEGMSECVLLSRLESCDFVFIDDLGKEFIGRSYNPRSSKWAEEKLFEVLNARYNAQKPTVFTSNYSIQQLADILSLDKAIVDRIYEMSTVIIKLDGDNFRKSERQRKIDIAKKLGI